MSDVARLLVVTSKTVSDWIKKENLPVTKAASFKNCKYSINTKDLVDWLIQTGRYVKKI